MLDRNRKFLFIHIPRTGGSSIEKQFQYREAIAQDKHWTLSDWEKQLCEDELKSLFKFSFVRNPWSMMISKYLSGWYSSTGGGEIGFHSGKTLKFFLTHYHLPTHEHGDAFFDYFDPSQMDFIGRFENRESDLKHISNMIGFKIRSNVHTRKVQAKMKNTQHYVEYYDDETRDIVTQKFVKEINYFGYKFGD